MGLFEESTSAIPTAALKLFKLSLLMCLPRRVSNILLACDICDWDWIPTVSTEHASTWPLTVRNPASHRKECVFVQLDWGSSSISASYQSRSLWHPLSFFGESIVKRLEKGLALLATNQLGKQACVFKGWASPLWFTAPTETKLGTATVPAPGPLSSGQDELFAGDIQMYKEQIRLTQSSFAWREREKRKGTGWLQKDPFRCASWMSERVGGMKTALCIQSANSQLIPLIHSWSTFNCVTSHSKGMFVAFNWRPLWIHWNV